jgi:hypothetical protein
MEIGEPEANENSKTFTDLNSMSNEATMTITTNSSSSPSRAQIANLLSDSTTITIINPTNSTSQSNNATSKLNKELQFLQAAISESGMSDMYQTFQINNTSSTNSQQPSLLLKSNNNFITITSNGIIQHDNLNLSQQEYQNVIQVTDGNIETVLQMQHELVEQQKEMKSIESETMEQLKLLQTNITKLAKKFESFEVLIANLNQLNNSNQLQNGPQIIQNGHSNLNTSNHNANMKTAKTTLNKIGSSIQQMKVRSYFS